MSPNVNLLNWVRRCHQGTVRRGASARRRTPGWRSQEATNPVPLPGNSTSLNSSSSPCILAPNFKSWPQVFTGCNVCALTWKFTLFEFLKQAAPSLHKHYFLFPFWLSQLRVCVYKQEAGDRGRELSWNLPPTCPLAFPSTDAFVRNHTWRGQDFACFSHVARIPLINFGLCWLQHLLLLNSPSSCTFPRTACTPHS